LAAVLRFCQQLFWSAAGQKWASGADEFSMDEDTNCGGASASFPATRCSVLRARVSDDPAARQQANHELIAMYWKPVYKYLRSKWPLTNEDAKDLTQSFFLRAMEDGFLDRFDPARARFRTYVRVCLDAFVANERRAANRLKRGGGVQHLALDFEVAEGQFRRQPLAVGADPDEVFRREWIRGVFALAAEDLRRQCAAAGRLVHFALFERYDLDGPDAAQPITYARLAQEFGLAMTQVTNHLAAVRRQFRALVLARLRAGTGSEEEFQEEVLRLFGEDAP
jgi:RNA polymerase sigma factor (sigma-70 family)